MLFICETIGCSCFNLFVQHLVFARLRGAQKRNVTHARRNIVNKQRLHRALVCGGKVSDDRATDIPTRTENVRARSRKRGPVPVEATAAAAVELSRVVGDRKSGELIVKGFAQRHRRRFEQMRRVNAACGVRLTAVYFYSMLPAATLAVIGTARCHLLFIKLKWNVHSVTIHFFFFFLQSAQDNYTMKFRNNANKTNYLRCGSLTMCFDFEFRFFFFFLRIQW